MIDYFTHIAALKRINSALSTESINEPEVAEARDRVMADVARYEDAAYLGACIDHVISHAISDGVELALLETAAGLWKRGLAIFNQITAIRESIEAAIAEPKAPDALSKFNAAIQTLPGMRTEATRILAEAETLKKAIHPLPHLRAHPRQEDKQINDWDWSNRFLARRSDAFVRAVFANASDRRSRAFAFGVLASYAGNAAGSGYLGHVVGGPRRSHRYRDRLARNTVGSWLAHNAPLPSLKDLANLFSFSSLTGIIHLPAGISAATQAGLREAFQTTELPDLDLGLRRLVRHLELLDSIRRPPLPSPPIAALDSVMGNLTPAEGGQVMPATADSLGTGDSQPGSGSTTQSSSKDNTGAVCIFLIFLVLILIAQLIDCIIQWIDKGECEPSVFEAVLGSDDPPSNVSEDFLTAAPTPPVAHTAAQYLQELYNSHLTLWQAFDQALSYLTVTGLVYPDQHFLNAKLYKQFTAISPPTTSWPQKPEPNPEVTYQFYPFINIEQPQAQPSFYPAGSNPLAFINGLIGTAFFPTVWEFASPLWFQIARGHLDTQNLDLDADRGQGHGCWQVAPGTSINDDPLNVITLAYGDI